LNVSVTCETGESGVSGAVKSSVIFVPPLPSQ
jgi:hypothetical protein